MRFRNWVVCAMGLAAFHASRAVGDTVTWTVDPDQSWIRLTIPDQSIDLGNGPVPVGLRGSPTTFDPNTATGQNPPVAPGWADNAGRLTNVQGTIDTDYTEGSSIQFAFGSDNLSLGEVGSFIPNRDFYVASPEGFNYHTLPPNGRAACFAFDVTLFGAARIAPVTIWGMNFDCNGTVSLSGSGPWNSSGGALTIGGEQGAQLDFWPLPVTGLGSSRTNLDTTQGANTGGITIEDLGGGNRKMTINVDCIFSVSINGLPLNNATYQGQIVATASLTQPAQIVNRFVYHGGFSGAGTPPDNAIDTVKQLAKEGTGAILSLDNLISSSRGVNGVVFDIENLGNGGALSASDFEVQVSPQGAFDAGSNPPAGWGAGPAPSSVTVVAGTPSRVRVEWPNNSISNRWLRLTVKANANTGLTSPETYYVGHLLGETTGLSGTVYTVAFADITPIRSQVGSTVDASSIVDIDKNGTVAFADISAMRANVGAQLTNVTIP